MSLSVSFDALVESDGTQRKGKQTEGGRNCVELGVEQHASEGHLLARNGIALGDHEAQHPAEILALDVVGEAQVGPGLLVKVVHLGEGAGRGGKSITAPAHTLDRCLPVHVGELEAVFCEKPWHEPLVLLQLLFGALADLSGGLEKFVQVDGVEMVPEVEHFGQVSIGRDGEEDAFFGMCGRLHTKLVIELALFRVQHVVHLGFTLVVVAGAHQFVPCQRTLTGRCVLGGDAHVAQLDMTA